jgi:hypothetical protein
MDDDLNAVMPPGVVKGHAILVTPTANLDHGKVAGKVGLLDGLAIWKRM